MVVNDGYWMMMLMLMAVESWNFAERCWKMRQTATLNLDVLVWSDLYTQPQSSCSIQHIQLISTFLPQGSTWCSHWNSVITTDASKARLNTFSQRSHSNQRYPKAWKSWKNSWVSVGLPRWFHMLHALCWNIPEPGISRYAPDMATKIRNNHSISSKTLRSARTTPGQLWMPEKGCEKGVWKG